MSETNRVKPRNDKEIVDVNDMSTGQGEQYHIGLSPGDVGDHILLCGDPSRAKRFAEEFMDTVELEKGYREFLTFTGLVGGLRMSIMATGIGPDNTEIAVIELLSIVKNPTLLRVGSCGALQSNITPGDLVITTGAVRLENTTSFFVPNGFPAVADHELIAELDSACNRLGLAHHLGITATAPGFYGAQGRSVGPFVSNNIGLLDDLERASVKNMEMEASVLLTLAGIGSVRAGAICAVYANRKTGEVLHKDDMDKAELDCLTAGVETLKALAKKDGRTE